MTSAFAPAKLNLYLHVTGQRDDGYHLLDSLVVFADVGDRITVKNGLGLTLDITGPFAGDIPCGPNNLVLQAAQRLAEQANIAANAQITLEKNLPVASGIGGGSADAAATLRALVDLWELEVHSDRIRHAAHQVGHNTDARRVLETLFTVWHDDLETDKMQALALELGADVPVCLERRSVYMGGIGEDLILAPPLPPVWMVLVNAGVNVSTPTVFKARTGEFSHPARFFQAPQDAADLASLLAVRTNDLTAPAIALAPVIQDVLHALTNTEECLLARMSGSGATCFGLFADQNAAAEAALTLTAQHANWWIQATKISAPPTAL